MRVLEAFQVSEQLTSEGLECEIEFGGKVIAVVKVRPADALLNADYRKTLADLSVGVVPSANLDEAEDRERLFKLYSRAVIVGWTWTDPADKKDPALKFNEKNAIALFRKAPKFFEGIQVAARRWVNYRLQHEEKATGN